MAKQQKNQTYVLKLNSGYLSKHNWNLSLKLNEIRKNPQIVVSLGSSQVLRWMLKIQGRQNDDAEATTIKKEIKRIKKLENSKENKLRISKLYDSLYKKQFQQDYMMLVMDSSKDYLYAAKNHFTITVDYGDYEKTVEYVRLFGTAGSIKKSTIMFVNKDIHEEIMSRINNGRYLGPQVGEDVKTHNGIELNYKFIPAKLSAYFALQCSASISVPWPRIIVVNDAEVKFNDLARIVRDSGNDENPSWPSVSDAQQIEINANVSDGMGFISPEMSSIWAEYLHEGTEPLSGYNTRCAFVKGMVFTVPFVQFAEEVAGTYSIKDAWGDERDVRDADVILTTSMLKLWDSYDGYEDYYQNCMKNDYDFCIAKSTPRELRNVHTTNYQNLQDFELSDVQIDDLVAPTVTKIKECLGLDWKKLILYMCGVGLNDKNVLYADSMCKAIMANPELVNDPYVRSKVDRMIKKRINSAKIGVLDIAGDYAILGNDPFSLLQSMFGMQITGLLKAGECYHKYWSDKNADEILLFRAPMTSHENVQKLRVVSTDEMDKWYKYIKTCCLINSWDMTATRLNGADYDSDTVFSTDNKVLIDAFQYKDTLMCIQDKVSKKIPTDEDFIKSDINGFGDSIGSVTNRGTNMISLRANFEENSEEYKTLTYRISTMMNYQQNAIDRIKGVVAQPIPKEWLESRLHKPKEDDSEEVLHKKQINYNIAAEIKPWFFIYRYSKLKSDLDKYVKSVKSNCKIRFGMTIDELYNKSEKTEEEELFIYNYEKYMPISRAPGTMNRICWKIEDEFKSTDVMPGVVFDKNVLKSAAVYSQDEYDSIKELYDEYNKKVQIFLKGIKKNESDKADRDVTMCILKEEFSNACHAICPSSEILANIVVDICYSSNKNKSFAWEISGEEIFKNVLRNNGNKMTFPCKDDNGDIEFCGGKYSLRVLEVGGDEV